jgi:uncharacterized cupredoxin-like copper-binding protein
MAASFGSVVTLGIAALAALTACGGNGTKAAPSVSLPTTPAPAKGKVVLVVERDYVIQPPLIKLKPGTYTFRGVNEGDAEHALAIEGQGVEGRSVTVPIGEETRLTVRLEPGKYQLYCPIDGHRNLGMEAQITVQAAK